MKVRFVLCALALLALTMGCADERDPINRVQANAYEKSFFVGDDFVSPHDNPEFWTQATLIDVGYGTQGYLLQSTFTMSPSRIVWEVTEDLLLGRLAYERIEGTDGKGVGGPTPDGQIVVAYRILKHFDIQRAYNPSTGEALNVIEENTTDRPWYQRRYFRVDWSQNLNTDAYDFDTLSLLGVYGGTTYTPLAYYVADPEHEDAPHFDIDDGYFDVTNKAFATPETIDLSQLGWGVNKFPSCYLPNDIFGGSEPSGNCNPTEVTIRQGFRKIVDTDYEPVHWEGYRFQAYGGFYKDRFGYERNYGMSDDKWRRFLNRYQIWERSHYYDDPAAMEGPVECYTPEQNAAYSDDPNLDENEDGTADQCWEVVNKLATAAGECDGMDDQECYFASNQKYGGSQCDSFRQRCTLPYRFRTLKPLAWHYTSRSNLAYWDGTYWATHDHDVAMRHAAMVARYAECMSTSNVDAKNYEEVKEACVEENPVYFGQMDDHLEAVQLATEVDDCRNGLTFEDYGPVNSAEREEKCVALADQIAAQRKLDAWEDSDPHRVAGIVALAKMPQQIVLCHSPVEANDPAACAPENERLREGLTMADCQQASHDADREAMRECRRARYARIGDLRYHAINVFEEPQSPSFWGIYSDAEDPLTGEAFAASVNVWSHVNDLFSQGVIDKIRYIKGELETEEITEGTYVRDWINAAEAASGAGAGDRMTSVQRDERLAAALAIDVPTLHELRDKAKTDPSIRMAGARLRSELQGVMASQGVPGHMAALYEARRKTLLGTEMEAELADPMMQQLGGVEELGINSATIEYASPLRMLNPHVVKQMNNLMEAALAERGMCVYREAPAPMSLTGLADVLERKFSDQWGTFGSPSQDPKISDKNWELQRADAMRRYIANRAHYAVVVHEMGHSIGERHNFVSSSDAMNYRPQYWQLRTKNGTVTEECKDYTDDGDSCTGPRWFDPMTKEERDNMIWMWMHSSVMDYAGEYTQDMLGLGAYDFAAHRMFYGDAVAVWAADDYKLGEDRADYMFTKMDSFGGLNGYQPSYTIDDPLDGIAAVDIHYSQYQRYYEFIKDCQEVDVDAWRPASWDEEKQGKWDPVADGLIVSVDGKYTKCRQQPVDYVPWRMQRFPTLKELKDAAHVTFEPYYRGGPAVDPMERVRVPYGFATDRWADLGNAAVYRHDNGADNYEIFNFFITQQEVQHIFDNYRRGNQSFSVRGASNRTLGRYNEKIRDGAKGLGLYHAWYEDIAQELNITHSSFWAFAVANWFPDQVLAAGMVFDHFARMFARPETGNHLYDQNRALRSIEDSFLEGESVVTIPNGATGYFGRLTFGGKLVENRLCEATYDPNGQVDPGCGEYDSDYTMNAGSYYDKAWVPYLMAESEDNFISDSRNDFVDGRYRSVSMADVFPEGYRRWLANYLTGDLDTTALFLGADAAGQPMVEMEERPDGTMMMWPAFPLGTVSWWAKTPEICFPAEGTTLCNTYDAYTGHQLEFEPLLPDQTLKIDPQVGFSQQKFLIAYTYLYLPTNEKRNWLDQMRLYKIGAESDPAIPDVARIEWHNPFGDVFVARRYGTEEIFGKVVEAGIAARILEYANSLMEKAFQGAWDANGISYIPDYDPVSGAPIVKYDPSMGSQGPPVNFASCNSTTNAGCTCEDNSACLVLKKYATVPEYMWQVGMTMYYGNPEFKGIYD